MLSPATVVSALRSLAVAAFLLLVFHFAHATVTVPVNTASCSDYACKYAALGDAMATWLSANPQSQPYVYGLYNTMLDSGYPGGALTCADIWAATFATACAALPTFSRAYVQADASDTWLSNIAIFTADGNACQLSNNVSRQLGVALPGDVDTGIATACYLGCVYDLDQAINVQFGEQWYRYGTWVGTVNACTTEPVLTAPVPTGGGGGGEEEPCPDEDEECTVGGSGANAFGTVLEALRGAPGDGTAGVLGPALGIPTWWPFFNDPGPRVCTATLTFPASIAAHFSNGQTELSIDLCDSLPLIDSVGGFLLYIFTAIGMYGIFFRVPGAA